MTDLEVSVSGKGLGFSPTPTFTNEADLRRNFSKFSRKMRLSGFFVLNPRKTLVKSNWSSPKCHPELEMFLSQTEGVIFSLLPGNSTSCNLTKEEWKGM